MWSIDPPSVTTREVFEACSNGTSVLSTRLRKAVESMEINAVQLQEAVEHAECWGLGPKDFPLAEATDEDVRQAYSTRLVRGCGRPVYDKILGAALRHQCPYCGYGIVTTLDHFLPKSTFGALALEPWNLVPACKDCNHTLSVDSAESADTEFIHPFVWVDDTAWLTATILHGDEPVADFAVARPADWSDETFNRVDSHFSRLDLGNRYAEISAATIHEITFSVQHICSAGRPGDIRDHLVEQTRVQISAYGLNHWRTALFRALADDEWYWQTWVWG